MPDGNDMILAVLNLPQHLGLRPSLGAAAEAVALDISEFDSAFGLVPIAPEQQMFIAKLRRKHLGRPGIGPEVSDPRIEPYSD